MATYYVDYATGANNTYTALNSCVASNPSGTITRITKTAHGLTNGNIVVLTNFSAWLNTQWTVTNANPNYFDLQGAVWQTTAITSGTVTRTWGRQWSEPWDRIWRVSSGVVPGDTFKVAKSPDPVSIGNATWTSKSITVTLATAQTTLIDDCDSGWTAAVGGDVTVTYDTTQKKSGTGRVVCTFDATPQLNIKQAYKTLAAPLNLSSYDSICFWFGLSGVFADNNRMKVVLCSDTTGDTIVDEFIIPAIAATSGYVSLNLKKNGGGALGSNINSIAIYTMGAAVSASTNYNFDNFNACNENGLHINSLISKSSTAWNVNEPWAPIKSINGTTLILDNAWNNYTMARSNTSLRGYYTTGTSPETVTTYIMNPIQVALERAQITTTGANTSAIDYYQGGSSGTAGNLITFSGGWDKNTDTRTGMTWVNARSNGLLFWMSTYDYLEYSYFGAMRCYSAFDPSTSSGQGTSAVSKTIKYCASSGCVYGGWVITFSPGFYKPTLDNIITSYNYLGCYNSLFQGTANNIYNYSNDSYFYIQSNYIAANLNNWKVYNSGNIDPNNRFYTLSTYTGLSFPQYYVNNFEYRDCIGPLFSTGNLNTNGSVATAYGMPNIYNSTFVNNSIIISGSPSYQGAVPRTYNIYNSTFTTNTNLFSNVYDTGFNFYNCSVDNATKNIQFSGLLTPTIYDKLNGNNDEYRYYTAYGNVLSQSTTTYSGSGIAWQINVTSSQSNATTPLRYKIASIAFNSSSLVTFKVWVKKSHATNIAAKLIILGGYIPGVTSDVTATKSDDTNWQELTVTFTPTGKGATDVYIDSWATASPYTNSIYVDSVTVTQA